MDGEGHRRVHRLGLTALIKEDLGSAVQVAQVVAVPCSEEGPTLGRPLACSVSTGSPLHHLKELRPGSRGLSGDQDWFRLRSDPGRASPARW